MTQPPNTQLFCSDQSMKPHLEKVLRGEYRPPLPGFFWDSCTVLDVGANVGAFSFWLKRTLENQHWRNPTIHCYEPLPRNFTELQLNLGKEKNVHLHNAAVSTQDGEATLYTGKNNCGECSLFKGVEQTDSAEVVRTIAASKLPKADVVKLDTEGSEVDILDGYVRKAGNRPRWVMLEYHGESKRHGVDVILREADYILVHIKPERPGRGIAFYLLRDHYAEVYGQNYAD